jgi:hypothetical protein
MTGVRVRSAGDRSILGLSSRLPEVATGFSGVDLIGSAHATNAWRAGSPGRGRHPFKTYEAAHVVDEIRHSDFAPRADDADGAHDPGSHPVLLITKYMLDAGAHIRARRIGGPLLLTEFAIAIGPAMNAALQAARVAHHVTAHEFVPAVDADMVLVTEIRAVMLLRPARVLVLLVVFGRLGFPVFRRFAFLDRLARIVLLGADTIVASMIWPAHGEIALVLQEPIKQIEQLFHRARLGQRLAIEPQSLGVGNRILQWSQTIRKILTGFET